jgi:hypothetical protein
MVDHLNDLNEKAYLQNITTTRKESGEYKSRQEFMTVFYASGGFLGKRTGCLSSCIVSYSLVKN